MQLTYKLITQKRKMTAGVKILQSVENVFEICCCCFVIILYDALGGFCNGDFDIKNVCFDSKIDISSNTFPNIYIYSYFLDSGMLCCRVDFILSVHGTHSSFSV